MSGETAQAIAPAAIVAISEAFTSKEQAAAKSEIAQPCRAAFDLTLKLSGVLKRGEATTVAPTCSLLNEFTFAELMRRLGVTQAAWKKHLLEIALEANVQGRSIKEQIENDSPELLLTIADIKRDVVAKMPRANRAGAISVACVKREFSKEKVEFAAA